MKLPHRSLRVALPASAQTGRSPEVQPDGRTTFRLGAPHAPGLVLRVDRDAPVSM
jgi:hypothetical protein